MQQNISIFSNVIERFCW